MKNDTCRLFLIAQIVVTALGIKHLSPAACAKRPAFTFVWHSTAPRKAFLPASYIKKREEWHWSDSHWSKYSKQFIYNIVKLEEKFKRENIYSFKWLSIDGSQNPSSIPVMLHVACLRFRRVQFPIRTHSSVRFLYRPITTNNNKLALYNS